MKRWFSILLLSGLVSVPVLAQSGIEIIGGDEASLRTFITRMMGPGPYDTEGVSIYIAELPANLPFELPIPDGANVIGATSRSDSTDILLDTDMEPRDVRDFYVEALRGDDWQDISQNLQGGGFRSGPTDAQFCYKGLEAQLNLFATENLVGTTDVRLYIQPNADPYVCAVDRNNVDSLPPNDPYRMIPELEIPEGVTIRDVGSGGGGSRPTGPTIAIQTATLETELTPEQIAAAYNAQLEETGWQQSDTGSSENIAWSLWTFTGNDETAWAGSLIIHASPLEENVYNAYIQVSRAPDKHEA